MLTGLYYLIRVSLYILWRSMGAVFDDFSVKNKKINPLFVFGSRRFLALIKTFDALKMFWNKYQSVQKAVFAEKSGIFRVKKIGNVFFQFFSFFNFFIFALLTIVL